MKRGAVVLCGGRSTRMGRDKASLPFGPETLLARVVRRVSVAVEDVVVVARPGQEVPALPSSVRIARDEVLDRGPLGGLVPGLRASRADVVYATACDVPFVRREVVDLLFERLLDAEGGAEAAVPEAEGFLHPLAAVYRTRVVAEMEALLSAGRLRPAYLFDRVRTVKVPEADLRRVDAELASLANLNTPDLYEEALARRKPVVRVELFETARRLAAAAEATVDAGTLGEALVEAAARFPALVPDVIREGRLGSTWRASVNARGFVEDPATPLADGDAVVLVSALAGG